MPTRATGSGCEGGANGVSRTPYRKEAEMDIVTGIRPLDYVLTGVMVALAAAIGFENVNAGTDADLAHALDSHSALMIPVFVVAALPILWRRRGILPAIGVSFVVIAASVPAFGWVTRCGFALPLSIAMAYGVARFAGSKQNHLIGLVGILGLHAIKDRPMAVDRQVVIRPMMYTALTYDHRIVDGSEAVQFLVRVKQLIEDPGALLLE